MSAKRDIRQVPVVYLSSVVLLRREVLRQAIVDGKASLALKTGGGGAEVERMRMTRAAAAAAGVDLKRRCLICSVCMDRSTVSTISEHACCMHAVAFNPPIVTLLRRQWAAQHYGHVR